jgi:hypothetical protein
MSKFFTVCVTGSFFLILMLATLDMLFFFGNVTDSEPVRLLFIVTREDALANWYSSLVTLAVALVALGVYLAGHRQPLWLLVTAFFLYAAVDDAVAIHERLGDELKMWVDDSAWDTLVLAFPSYSWQLFIAPLFALIAIYIARRLFSQLSIPAFLWLFIGFSLLAVAISVDFVEGLLLKALAGPTVNHLLRVFEEVLEMSGMTLVFFSFGHHLTSLVEITYRQRT